MCMGHQCIPKGSAEISAKSMTKKFPPISASFIYLDELSGFSISCIADHGTLSMLGRDSILRSRRRSSTRTTEKRIRSTSSRKSGIRLDAPAPIIQTLHHHHVQLYVTGGIQKTVLYLKIRFFLILHRATRKTITFKMVLAGLKSVDEKYPNSNLKSSHLRLLSIGDDDCASPPCDSPGRYGRYGYPGEDTDMDTTRGRR